MVGQWCSLKIEYRRQLKIVIDTIVSKSNNRLFRAKVCSMITLRHALSSKCSTEPSLLKHWPTVFYLGDVNV